MRYDHTNTIAVQGAAARMISPAVYSLAISGPIHAAKRCCMNTHASRAILNGLISQFTTSVTSSPLGRLVMPPMALKSTFNIIG